MKITNIIVVYLLVFGWGCGADTLSNTFEPHVDIERSSKTNIPDANINSDMGINTDTELNSDTKTISDVENNEAEPPCENVTFLGVSMPFTQHTVEMIQIKDGFVVIWQSSTALEIRTLNKEGVVVSGQHILRKLQESDPPPQLFAMDEGSSFIVLYKDGEEIYFTSSYSRGWFGTSSDFRGTPYSSEEGWFPILVQLDDRWMRPGTNGARQVDLKTGDNIRALSWNGTSIVSVQTNEQDSWQLAVLEGISEFTHEWRPRGQHYSRGFMFDRNASESGRHAALLGSSVLIEGASPLILEGVLSSTPGAMPPGNIYWNGESYSVLLLGLETAGEKTNGYFFKIDEKGTQVGKRQKLFSTKSVQHSRSQLPFPALVASSPNQLATAWIEDGNQVYFGCFSNLAE